MFKNSCPYVPIGGIRIYDEYLWLQSQTHTNTNVFNVHEKQISLASYIDGLTISNPNLYIHCPSIFEIHIIWASWMAPNVFLNLKINWEF